MNAWQKLREEPQSVGRRALLRRWFLLPDGQEAEYVVMDEPKVVTILALTEENKVVLARQYRPGPEQILLELPGGAVEAGEEPLAAAARELLEETGYVGDLALAGESLHCAYSTRRRFAYAARNCRKIAEPSLDDTEFVEVVEMPLEAFRVHLFSGNLTDMAAGYQCLDFLRLL